MKEKIMDRINWDSSLEKSKISIEVDNKGVVTATGTAPNYRSRRAAMKRIYEIDGVKKIQNKIEVDYSKESEEISDEEIATNIRNVLKSSSDVRSDEFKLNVNNGSVMIEGSVDSFWKKDKILDLVTDVHGVLGYIDNIVVVPAQKKEDEEIAKTINQKITQDQRLHVPNIDIAVNNGTVYLNGEVLNYPTYERLVEVVKFTKGVTEIKNNLELID